MNRIITLTVVIFMVCVGVYAQEVYDVQPFQVLPQCDVDRVVYVGCMPSGRPIPPSNMWIHLGKALPESAEYLKTFLARRGAVVQAGAPMKVYVYVSGITARVEAVAGFGRVGYSIVYQIQARADVVMNGQVIRTWSDGYAEMVSSPEAVPQLTEKTRMRLIKGALGNMLSSRILGSPSAQPTVIQIFN